MADAITPFKRPSAQAAAITLRYANDAIACLTVGCLGTGAFHDFPRIDIKTTNGQAALSGRDHIWESLSWSAHDDQATHRVVVSPESLGSTRYTHAMQHFVDCIRNGQQPLSGIDDGVKTVAMAMAVDVGEGIGGILSRTHRVKNHPGLLKVSKRHFENKRHFGSKKTLLE